MAEPNAQVINTPFKADIVGKDGKVTSQNMNVRVISVQSKRAAQAKARTERGSDSEPEPAREAVKRQTQQGQATSNITPLEDGKATYKDIIEAPYDQFALVLLEEESNVLRECIDSMVTTLKVSAIPSDPAS